MSNECECIDSGKKWREKPENKEKMKVYLKDWREKNKDKLKEQRKKYYDSNKDKILDYTQKWRDSNPEKVKQYYEKMKEKYKNDPEFREKQKQAYKKWYEKNKTKINKPETDKTEKGEKISQTTCTDSNVATATSQSS